MNEKLTVHEMGDEDTWRDIARLPRAYRKDEGGVPIHRASVCRVSINGKHKLLAIHGCSKDDARILLDSPTRGYFGVRVGLSYEVKLERARWFGYWRWAWDAAEPAYRVPAQISLLSLILGAIGLLLGVISLLPFLRS